MSIDVIELLSRLVACPSVNPGDETPTGPPFGEARLCALLADLVTPWGAEVRIDEVAPGRPNFIARFAGERSDRSLMFEAHADTVLVDDMTIPPFEPTVKDGRLYGRGSCDTKASMAAMLAAIRTVLDAGGRPPTDLYFVATCNEVRGATGADALMDSSLRPTAAVVGEPTELRVIHAHKGVARWRISTRGVAAHSSTPELGVNAISMMQRVIAAIDGPVAARLKAKTHPSLGRPTISVGTIAGGTQVNVVPAECAIEVDRRLVPPETPKEVEAELTTELEQLRSSVEGFAFDIEQTFFYPPFSEDADSPIVSAAREACRAALGAEELGVAAYGTNAGHFKRAGIPCVVLGPGSARQAHTVDEYVSIEQVEKAVQVYAAIIRGF